MGLCGPVIPPIETPSYTQVRSIAGFWRRILAFVIDVVVTGLLCLVLGLFFRDAFEHSPVWSSLIGLALTLAYFSSMGSSEQDGQTLGMRFCSIQVVNRDGSSLSLGRSLLRYSILLTPILLSSVFDAGTSSTIRTAVSYLLSSVVLAIFYLFIFNSRTRQSLHDLAVGTFVVDAPGFGEVEAPAFWRMHWFVLPAIIVLFYGASVVLAPRLLQMDPFPELVSIPSKVQELPIVRDASVVLRKSSASDGTHTGLLVTVSCRSTPSDYQRTATEIVAVVMRADPRASERDYIGVIFLQGFEVGFAKFHHNQAVTHTPGEWNDLIKVARIG
jgi:uncharacterized RDD family membrane protein YckC